MVVVVAVELRTEATRSLVNDLTTVVVAAVVVFELLDIDAAGVVLVG